MEEDKQQEFLNLKKEFKEKYPELSKEDVDFYFPEKRILDFKVDFVSIRKYESLIEKRKEFNNYNFANPTKEQKHLSELELSQIENFQNRNQQTESDKFENRIAHWNRVFSGEKPIYFSNEGLLPDKKTIYRCFLISYKFLNGVDFIINEESIKNIEPIIKYFAFDKTFFDSQNSVKVVGNKVLEPSFKKGLLLIGNVGNGKTSVMKALQFMIDFYAKKSIDDQWDTAGDWAKLKFKFKTTESLVTEYEFLKSGQEKEMFFSKYSKTSLLLDDMKREKDASNFGITNVVKSILEKIYNNQKQYSEEKTSKIRTFGTMNFHKDFPNNIDFAIQECGVRYGSHVYDRFFEMFNIVVFNGKSFRR